MPVDPILPASPLSRNYMPPVRVRVFPILMILFLVIPIIEIYLLIQVGSMIGVLPTIGLVILTAIIGASLLRSQGLQTYMRFNQSLSQGRVPANEILEGVALLVGGALLLTPGFFTDMIGFFCLLSITRRPVVTFIVNRFNPLGNFSSGSFSGSISGVEMGDHPSRPSQRGGSGNVYEGEVTQRSKDH